MRSLFLATVVMALSTTAFAQSLSGNQIRERLVGNIISGVDKGECFSQVLNPDGSIAAQSPSGTYWGRWNISGNKICLSYESESDCTGVKLRGSRVIWDDGTSASLKRGIAGYQADKVRSWPRSCRAKTPVNADDDDLYDGGSCPQCPD
jgi:hypothetical protein